MLFKKLCACVHACVSPIHQFKWLSIHVSGHSPIFQCLSIYVSFSLFFHSSVCSFIATLSVHSPIYVYLFSIRQCACPSLVMFNDLLVHLPACLSIRLFSYVWHLLGFKTQLKQLSHRWHKEINHINTCVPSAMFLVCFLMNLLPYVF